MKEEWKPEELLATSEEIREAVMPKSITPEMVGRVLCGLVDAMENVAAHREDVAVYPFRGIVDTPEETAWEGLGAGAVVFCNGSAAFIRKEVDGGFCFAGEDYNEGTEETGYYARTDRFYRCGAELYRAEEDHLVRLIGERDLSEKTQELRREIVGLWDETAKIQAKLADLYSTETENLLKRLGYGAEDIEEYIWAVSHLDLDISLDDLRQSVAAWEAGEDWDQKVAPKWTEEMEAGEETPAGLKASRFNSALYYPHITTGKEFWINGNSACGRHGANGYIAGIKATAPLSIIIGLAGHGFGLGAFTGQIQSFRLKYVDSNVYGIRCLKLLKSDIPVNLNSAFQYQVYVDFGNVHVENATDLGLFSPIAPISSYFGRDRKLPAGFSEMGKSIPMKSAFGGCKFTDETIDLTERETSGSYMFTSINPDRVPLDMTGAAVFDGCDIDVSDMESGKLHYFGYFVVPSGSKSRMKAHGVLGLYCDALVSPYWHHETSCGVWEVDCPDVQCLITTNCAGVVSATFWNLGACLTTPTLKLRDLMRSYQDCSYRTNYQPVFYGFMAYNEGLRESFRNSLRSWVSPPAACTIVLYSEQYDVLTEEEIAELTEKGYSIVVDDSPVNNIASFKLQ